VDATVRMIIGGQDFSVDSMLAETESKVGIPAGRSLIVDVALFAHVF
jgi:hypothetical protein